MRRVSKSVFFFVFAAIVAMSVAAFSGVNNQWGDIKKVYIKGAEDIRWGIDIKGGVDVTLKPEEGVQPNKENMLIAEDIIKQRLLDQNIADSEVYTDCSKGRVIVRFPWKQDEAEFDPEEAIKELAATAKLTFRESAERDEQGKPKGVTLSNVVLTGANVQQAYVSYDNNNEPAVSLKLNKAGAKKFQEATSKLVKTNGQISIWMDDELIYAPRVQAEITNGEAKISGMGNINEAKKLANKINDGALPFKLITDNFSVINPTLGINARDAMLLAVVIAFTLVLLFMIFNYRVSGIVYAIALVGQISFTVAAITGFLPFIPSFTLTLPGIAGIILSIGMGVDAGVIISERIKEEISKGKTVKGAIDIGFNRGVIAILDGNATVLIVAAVLVGSFGPPSSLFVKLFKPVFAWFGHSTAGTIYSFGYTLMVGAIANVLFGVLAAKLMLKSLVRFKLLKKASLYGGGKNEE
ncbi:MAG: preprotein translocase subunit SecD [Oscillospiraceae bacterium]